MMIDQSTQKKLGEILIERGAIEAKQLQKALHIQSYDKSILGKILIGENYLKNFELHKAIAEKHGLKFVNLLRTILNYDLLKDGHYDDYFHHQMVPYSEF